MSFQVEARLLKAISSEEIGFRSRGLAGYSYHLWTSDTEYRTLTPAERRILFAWLSSGKVRRVHAVGNFSRGYVAKEGG
jgi:hypothetical protein